VQWRAITRVRDRPPEGLHVHTYLSGPWPWYVTGPVMGLIALALLLYDGRMLGVAASYRTVCAAALPGRVEFFHFDWWNAGGWNLAFVAGLALGGFVSVHLLGSGGHVAITTAAHREIAALGIRDFGGLVPHELFSWQAALSLRGVLTLGVGGLLVGFGSSYAGGCTSGHGILGLADLQLSSFVAVIGFSVGGIFAAHVLLPLIL
jgi:uncharacterized membrane protein YedE/YeeE